MSFSDSQGVHINNSSLIHVQGNMHVHTSQYEGDVLVRGEYYNGANADHASPFNQPLIVKPVLPPRPRWVIGRDREINSLVDELLHTVTPRLAILGTGGIGKTTLALAVLHDERVSARWKSKIYFINCESVISSELLVKELADVLRIPPHRRDFDIFDTVLEALAGTPAILCLDNFETPWDDPDLRSPIESALLRLNGVQGLALLITMRGIQRPAFSAINWSTSLEPLKQLAVEDAERLFKAISNQMDEWSKKLVRAVDCVPLAVTLLAQIISEGTESTESLWGRWMTESTAVVDNGGRDRLSKLDTSIQISVSKVDEHACQVLGMIALLPDGLHSSEEHIMDLQARIPNDIKLKLALTALARRALIYRRDDHYQMLTPIRHFTLQKIPISTAVKYGLIATYLMAWMHNRSSDANASYSVVHPEVSNFENILLLAFSMENIPGHLRFAAIAFTEWFGWDLTRRAGDAKKAFMQALQLHETAHGVLLQAHNYCWIGVIQIGRKELDNAETSFKQALELHSQAGHVLGQANDHSKLGDIHMRRSELDDSLTSLKQALQLFEQAQSVVGQAHAHHKLGELHMLRNELDDAEISLKQALKLYGQLQYVRSQANACRKLGELHMYRDELDDAEMSFKQALQLDIQVKGVHSQADDYFRLGEMHMRRSELDDALTYLKQALQLYEQLQIQTGQVNVHRKLGLLHMRRNELDDAAVSFKQALQLNIQTDDVGSQALYISLLGMIHLNRNALDDAEMSLKQALQLHNQVDDVHGQADDHYGLGETHMRRDELDNALKSFRQALQLSEQSQYVQRQADACLKLGELHMHRDELDDAEMSFKLALPLHNQADDVRGQATDHAMLGRIYVSRDELEDAEMSFKHALRLHSQANDVRDQADDLSKLGELHVRRDKLDDALTSLKQALQLYEQLQDVLGQADVHRQLGELHIRRGEADDAAMSLKGALQLYEQINDMDEVTALHCLLTHVTLSRVMWKLSEGASTSHPSTLPERSTTALERFEPSQRHKPFRKIKDYLRRFTRTS